VVGRVSTTALLGFTFVALLAVLTPGLDTTVTLRHALLGGRGAGAGAVLGIAAGCVLWGAAGALGLAALLAASQTAYRALQLLGAGYLIWLGGSALWRSLRRGRVPVAEVPTAGAGPGAAFRAGLVTNLLNPKIGAFYLSLLPQFVPAGAPAWGALLVATHVGIGVLWLGTVVLLASRARRLLLRERVRRWLDRATAGVLLGLGVAIVVDAR
jgi:threonine/homoserine/homoserine lactone efflux protein